MRRKIPCLIFCLSIVAFSAAESLTLQTSLEHAAKNNPRLLLAKKDLAVAQTQLRQAKSLFYPRVHLNLDYVRYRHETLGTTAPELGGVVLEAPIAPNKSGTRGNPLAENLYLGRLGFLQTLYAGGKISTTYKLSQAGVRRAETAYNTLQHEVEFETTQYFYKLIALHKKEKILRDALREVDAFSKAAGTTHSRLAVSAAQGDLRNTISDLKLEEKTVCFNYLRAMGAELFSDADVEGEFFQAQTIPSLQTVLVWAKQNRDELKETQIQEEVDHLSVELSRAERYPVFLLGGGVEKRNNEFPLDETNWNAALSMNIPLFDGFSSWARIKESKYRADQGRLKRIQLEDQVEVEIRSAYNDWEHWAQEVRSRSEQKEFMLQARREERKNASTDSFSQRLDYVRWMAAAQASLIDAQFERCLAEARLTKAAGRPLRE